MNVRKYKNTTEYNANKAFAYPSIKKFTDKH